MNRNELHTRLVARASTPGGAVVLHLAEHHPAVLLRAARGWAAVQARPPMVPVPLLIEATLSRLYKSVVILTAPDDVIRAAGWQVSKRVVGSGTKGKSTFAELPPGVTVQGSFVDLPGEAPELGAFVTWADAVHNYFTAHPDALTRDEWGHGRYEIEGYGYIRRDSGTASLTWLGPALHVSLERAWPALGPPRLVVRRIRYPGRDSVTL